MQEHEVRTRVAGMSRTKRAIYESLEKDGPLAAFELAKPLGRGDGLTKELRGMLREGVIRRATARRWTGRSESVAYEVTPFEQVEQEREQEVARQKQERRKPKAGGVPYAEQAHELRKLVQGGNASEWIKTRLRVLDSFPILRNVSEMSFWANVPWDELEYVLEEMRAVREAVAESITSLERRKEIEDTMRKIEKLESTNGRTEEEAAAFKAKAREMRRSL